MLVVFVYFGYERRECGSDWHRDGAITRRRDARATGASNALPLGDALSGRPDSDKELRRGEGFHSRSSRREEAHFLFARRGK